MQTWSSIIRCDGGSKEGRKEERKDFPINVSINKDQFSEEMMMRCLSAVTFTSGNETKTDVDDL